MYRTSGHTGGDVAGSQKLSPTAIGAKFSILDLQLLLKIIEHVSDDFGNETEPLTTRNLTLPNKNSDEAEGTLLVKWG